MDVRVGPLRKLSTEKLMLFNCGIREEINEKKMKEEISSVQFSRSVMSDSL